MSCCLSLQLTQGHPDRHTQRQLARQTVLIDKSDNVKHSEMTERWAARNDGPDDRGQLPDTNRQKQVGPHCDLTGVNKPCAQKEQIIQPNYCFNYIFKQL